MKPLRAVLVFLLIFSLAGCVYFRLWALKQQLEKFDENFATEVSDHFTLIFKNPVLLSGDFVELAHMQPSKKESTPEGSRWIQAFHKVDVQGRLQKGVDFYFTLDFDRENYLTRWDFSRIFMEMVPPQFFEDSIRSLAKGKVDEANHKFKVAESDRAKVSGKLPTLHQIISNLGEPLLKGEEDGRKVYLYRFLVDTPHIDKEFEDRRFTDVKLFFDPKTDELVRMGGKFVGLKINIWLRPPEG